MPSKPFTIMVSNKEQINEFVDLDEKMKRLIDKFMPGEITLLFPRKKSLPFHLTLNENTVGIRMPNDEKLLAFISKVPGGVGPITNACLMKNVLNCYLLNR